MPQSSHSSPCQIGIVTVSDRAFWGEYQDRGGPELVRWLSQAIKTPWQAETRLVPDERVQIADCLKHLITTCSLIFTTGGTGPAQRDVTPEATADVCEKMLPGFGELMRAHSLRYVATSILARQTAGIYQQTLIINLPGSPKAIAQSLEAIFPAVPYCLDLIGGAWLDTHSEVCSCFRPTKE